MPFAQRVAEAQALFTEFGDFELRALETLALVLVLLLLRWVAGLLIRRNVADERTRYTWRKSTTYVLGVVATFLIARVWFEGVRSLATFLGLFAAGLAVALKDPVLNLAGWLFILSRRPFVVGDRIQLGRHSGDVVDQRIFEFTVLEIGNWVHADQSTGRIIHVPNGKVFTEPLANYTRGFPYIWNELEVTVTFESDWRAAKELLLEIVKTATEDLDDAQREIRAASRLFLIHYGTLTPTVYTSVVRNGVRLTLRYLCRARARRGTAQALWESILDAFAARADIAFAYPTQRFYDRAREGKPGPVEDRA